MSLKERKLGGRGIGLEETVMEIGFFKEEARRAVAGVLQNVNVPVKVAGLMIDPPPPESRPDLGPARARLLVRFDNAYYGVDGNGDFFRTMAKRERGGMKMSVWWREGTAEWDYRQERDPWYGGDLLLDGVLALFDKPVPLSASSWRDRIRGGKIVVIAGKVIERLDESCRNKKVSLESKRDFWLRVAEGLRADS